MSYQKLLVVVSFLVFNVTVHAGAYECTNSKGEVTFQGRPCAATQQSKKVKIIKAKKHNSNDSAKRKGKAFFDAQDKRLNEFNSAQDEAMVRNLDTPKSIDKPDSLYIKEKPSFEKWMGSRERVGATMSEDEKNWRDWDEDKLKQAKAKFDYSNTREGMLEAEALQRRAEYRQIKRERARSQGCQSNCDNY